MRICKDKGVFVLINFIGLQLLCSVVVVSTVSKINQSFCCWCSGADSLWPHRLQHFRLTCPPLSPRVCSNSYPLSRRCYLSISPSAALNSFYHQSFPTLESFLMSQVFASGGQSIGGSALASVLPMNIQAWSPCCPRDSQQSSPTPQFKSINSLALSFLHSPTLTSIHDHRKNHSLD